ncbi:arginyltransferase [Anaerolineales bacterium HSG6]|nr:arginyltransferase [Anaerolineales bacterium HSG6]
MLLFQQPTTDDLAPCSYLPNRQKQFQYFLGTNVSAEEISWLLARGWRKFGIYYFRPVCPTCRACIPLRVQVADFKPSKSQRRILKKNSMIGIRFVPRKYSERAFEIYQDHSINRFSEPKKKETFKASFYRPSCPGLQSEYYLNGEMIALGFLDQGEDGLSSVYFVFDTSYSELGLGTFSILKEIEYAKKQGVAYYYLGYYIEACGSMAYKDRFKPREHYDWFKDQWNLAG